MATWKKAASWTLIAFAVLFGVAAALLVGALVAVQSGWAERRLETLTADRIGREVDLEGLRVLAAWPPQVELGALRIANPDWAHDRYLLDARGMRATLEPKALLQRRIVATAAVDDAAIGLEKQGDRTTWDLDLDETGKREGDSRLALRSVSIGELRAAYRDAEEKTNVLVHASGDLGREGRPFQARGEGQLRGEPLRMSAQAPTVPLAGDQPVQLSFEVNLAKTRTAGQVAMRAATDALQSMQGRIEASGPSVAALQRVVGAELPKSAPYRVSANVRHEDGQLSVENLRVTLGKSDLQGSASLETKREHPLLRASFTSNLFDVEETGIKPKVKEEVQEAQHLLSRDPWPTKKWDTLDAELDLKVKKVRNAHPVPIDALEMRVMLENSSLRVDPVRISLAGGTVSGRVALDAGKSPARGSARIDIGGLRLSRLFPKVEQKEVALGRLNGRIELSGSGDTPAKLLGNANGRILFAAERGTASALLVEVLGLDAAEAATLLGKKKTPLPLRCAVVDLTVKNGTAQASTFVIDATDTVLSVEGSVELGKERLSLVARAQPRDASAFTLRTPINIRGTFLDPKVRPRAGPLAGRAAAAVALAAINPLLALIPFVDPGEDPESGCRQKP